MKIIDEAEQRAISTVSCVKRKLIGMNTEIQVKFYFESITSNSREDGVSWIIFDMDRNKCCANLDSGEETLHCA